MNESEIEKWKKQLERLNLQIKLGQMEARKLFIDEQKKLHEWAQSIEFNVNDLGESITDKENEFKVLLEKLHSQIIEAEEEAKQGSTKTEKEQVLAKHHEKVNAVIAEIQNNINSYSQSAEEKLNEFKLRFNLFELQLKEKEKENHQAWEKKKKEVEKQIDSLKNQFNRASQKSESALTALNDEILDSWLSLKDSINSSKKDDSK